MTTGGPIRSFAFSKEKELVMSFACYRFIYYFSIAFAFFITIGVEKEIYPFLVSGLLIFTSIFSMICL
jgi:hypothetical protein